MQELKNVAGSVRGELKHICKCALWPAIVAVLSGALAFIVVCEVENHANVLESGPVELTQLGLLFATSAVFAWRASRKTSGTPRAFAVCALVVLAMAVRELDGPLDKLLWHGSWFVLDMCVALCIVFVIAGSSSKTVLEIGEFCRSQRFPLFVAGIAAAVVFSQILGWKGIWNRIFDIPFWTEHAGTALDPTGCLPAELDIPRHVKNAAEESFELASYMLLFMSAAIPSPASKRACGGGNGRG